MYATKQPVWRASDHPEAQAFFDSSRERYAELELSEASESVAPAANERAPSPVLSIATCSPPREQESQPSPARLPELDAESAHKPQKRSLPSSSPLPPRSPPPPPPPPPLLPALKAHPVARLPRHPHRSHGLQSWIPAQNVTERPPDASGAPAATPKAPQQVQRGLGDPSYVRPHPQEEGWRPHSRPSPPAPPWHLHGADRWPGPEAGSSTHHQVEATLQQRHLGQPHMKPSPHPSPSVGRPRVRPPFRIPQQAFLSSDSRVQAVSPPAGPRSAVSGPSCHTSPSRAHASFAQNEGESWVPNEAPSFTASRSQRSDIGDRWAAPQTVLPPRFLDQQGYADLDVPSSRGVTVAESYQSPKPELLLSLHGYTEAESHGRAQRRPEPQKQLQPRALRRPDAPIQQRLPVPTLLRRLSPLPPETGEEQEVPPPAYPRTTSVGVNEAEALDDSSPRRATAMLDVRSFARERPPSPARPAKRLRPDGPQVPASSRGDDW